MATNRFKRPMNEASNTSASVKSVQKELEQARSTGTLNLANRGMSSIDPTFYSDANKSSNGSFDSDSPRWWEAADLRKLFIQCNKLRDIPVELIAKVARSLLVLDAHENCISELSVLVGDLQALQSFNLSHNSINILPPTFVNLTSLVELKLNNNKLSELPMKWSTLSALSFMDISGNNVKFLPDDIGNCGMLTHLNASNNSIEKLPISFQSLKKLQFCDLSSNRLSQISTVFPNNLNVLKLDRNSLKSSPDIRHCRQLKELSVCDNLLMDFVVHDMDCVKTISILSLRGNKITAFPDDIATALLCIERLDLANNNLSSIPLHFGLIESLKVILVDGNPLKILRRDIVSRGTVAIKQFLVSRLPEASQPPEKDVSVKNAIPQSMTADKVDLTGRAPESIPSLLVEIGGSPRDVILSKCRLQSIENLLTPQLSNVVFFDVSCNGLRSLPDNLALMQMLRHLNISNNRIAGALPNVIYKLTRLEVLLAGDNSIESLDDSKITSMENLSVFDIRNNNLAQLSPALALMKSLKTLEVSGNAFKIPRQDIVRKGSSAILEFLRTKLP